MPLSYTVENSKHIIHLTGRLDTKTSTELRGEILNLVQNLGDDSHQSNAAVDFRPDIVLDLGKVDYLGSMFLRICAEILELVGKEHLSITNATPSVKKIFQIAGLEKLISIS